MNEHLRRIIAILYPERCPFCDSLIEADEIACKACLARIGSARSPIVRGAQGYRCVSSFIYDGSVRRMLIRIKFYEHIQHIRQAAFFLGEDIRASYGDAGFDLITAVPMHPKDLRARGFDQCELLAKELSVLLGVPYQPTLEKVKRTKKQHTLKYRERKKNLSGAFKVIDKARVESRRILIVDDIVTSGYTLGYCCRALSRAKPELLCCATIANADAYCGKAGVI